MAVHPYSGGGAIGKAAGSTMSGREGGREGGKEGRKGGREGREEGKEGVGEDVISPVMLLCALGATAVSAGATTVSKNDGI